MPYFPDLSIERPCQGEDCPCDAAFIISNTDSALVQCYDHLEDVLEWLDLHKGDRSVCIACDRVNDETYQVEVENYSAILCRRHAIEFLSYTLTPEAYANLYADAGYNPDISELGRSNYDEVGQAIFPYPVGCHDVASLVFRIIKSGDSSLISAWEGSICEHPELIVLVMKSFESATGFPTTPETAHMIMHQILHSVEETLDDLGGSGGYANPDLQDNFRPVILDILRFFDPERLISMELSAEPYQKEAAWLSKSIWGHEDADLYHLYQLVCHCFKFDLERDEDMERERVMNRITSRLIAKVVLPMAEMRENGENWKTN